MYFIELIVKKFIQKKEKPTYKFSAEDENKEYENCEHLFMPIDSTEETLSCTRCGILVKRSELHKKNFFM